MRIVTARRISQAYFFLVFLWLCVVASVGDAWWQIRGWPANWFLQLDPLVALGTVLTTGTVYAGLLWALVTVVLTILLGRFFCSWVCPFGTLHHAVGHLAARNKGAAAQVKRNQYRNAQSVKYVLLFILLGAGLAECLTFPGRVFAGGSAAAWRGILLGCLLVLFLVARKVGGRKSAVMGGVLLAGLTWIAVGWFLSGHTLFTASLQTGLLDPLPLFHRSVGLVVLPLVDGAAQRVSVVQRFGAGAWLIGGVFLAAVLMNLVVPRFYCRFICPLGALFGVLSRYALWRMGGSRDECRTCKLCERHCEGACEPSGKIRVSECILCMNCVETCGEGLMGYRTTPSPRGEVVAPDMSRRGFLLSAFSGAAAVPAMRLGGSLSLNWSPRMIRPPGALTEKDFLRRCIKCGQCMRICPTNIIQPAVFEGGLEGFWSPVLNFRIGTSGCQYNCVACGQVCPTAAIRPIGLEEKQGSGKFAPAGPIRVGTAFVDRGRCLPWAMDRPCIVCQENCPVSPKAIFTRVIFRSTRNGRFLVTGVNGLKVFISPSILESGAVATGDYYMTVTGKEDAGRRKIVGNDSDHLLFSDGDGGLSPKTGEHIDVQVKLKQPYVDLKYCTGCGICEHECPVSGQRAIRVTAENETRNKTHQLLL